MGLWISSGKDQEDHMSAPHILLGDIGATNARFALLANGVLGPIQRFKVADYERFSDVVSAFLNGHCVQLSITDAVFAVAAPMGAGRCALTNCSWVIDAAEL